MFFLDSKVLEIINDALRGLAAHLCEVIYSVIADIYEVFVKMTELIYTDDLTAIYNKISLFLGIFMIFRLSFWLIEALMNPDILGDKAKAPGEMIKKVFLVVVLLGITPSIFKYAYRLQYEVVNSNVIPKIMSIGNYNAEVEKPDEFGKLISAELFIIFYNQNSNINVGNDSCVEDTGKNGKYYSYLKIYGKLYNLAGSPCLVKRTNDEYVIDFNGLFAVGVGAFVFWMMLMYCISLGARYVQLIFLQVIAPIPIMGYLSTDKDNMFSKWVKQCTTTYLDVFIRLVIVHFTMWLISAVITNDSSLSKNITSGSWLIRIFIILGLLTFAKKAPELIQELLPKSLTKASGDFGLSWKKRTDAMLGGNLINGAVKRAPGYVAGGVVGGLVGGAMGIAGGKGVGSRIMGGITGLGRGLKTGTQKGSIIKNVGDVKKNQATRNNKLQQWRQAAGKNADEANTFGDWFGRVKNAGKQAMGFETDHQYFERAKTSAKSASDAFKNAKDNSIQKAIEKSVDGSALGINTTLTEIVQKQKAAQAAVTENNKTSLLSTVDGNNKLANFLGTTSGQSWLTSNGLTINTSFQNLNQDQKDQLAEDFMKHLRAEQTKIDKEYEDESKKFGFLFQIKAMADGSEEYKNYFATINEFIEAYDDEFGITKDSGEHEKLLTRQLEPGKPFFDIDKMISLKTDAEAGDANAQAELEAIYEDWETLKKLQSRVQMVERDEEHRTAAANDKFNPGSGK